MDTSVIEAEKDMVMARAWEPMEMQLVAEFMAEHFPDGGYAMRFRLGGLHPTLAEMEMSDAERRMVANSWRRWADAVAWTNDRLILIEGKLRADVDALAQLELYKRLIPSTVELMDHFGKPVEMWFVFAYEDPVITALAHEKDIVTWLFKPDWVAVKMAERAERYRRAKLTAPLQ